MTLNLIETFVRPLAAGPIGPSPCARPLDLFDQIKHSPCLHACFVRGTCITNTTLLALASKSDVFCKATTWFRRRSPLYRVEYKYIRSMDIEAEKEIQQINSSAKR